MRVLCNGKTLAFQANDRSSILLTRSNFLERSHVMKQTKEQRDAIVAEAVTTAKEHTAELNSGPMKHTLQRRAALEKKTNKRR